MGKLAKFKGFLAEKNSLEYINNLEYQNINHE